MRNVIYNSLIRMDSQITQNLFRYVALTRMENAKCLDTWLLHEWKKKKLHYFSRLIFRK
jgi:hypothetical protein